MVFWGMVPVHKKALVFVLRENPQKEQKGSNPHLHLRLCPQLLFSLCAPSPLALGFPFASLEGPSSDLLDRGAC